MSRKDDIKKLLVEHERHLQKLKEQQASLGLYTPPYILTEIEDTESQIERLHKQNTLTIDSRPLLGIDEGKVLELRYDSFETVQELQDEIYFTLLEKYVSPYTYKIHWLLRSIESRKVFKAIGTQWAKGQGLDEDTRPLDEVGIEPGMTLEIVSPKKLQKDKAPRRW